VVKGNTISGNPLTHFMSDQGIRRLPEEDFNIILASDYSKVEGIDLEEIKQRLTSVYGYSIDPYNLPYSPVLNAISSNSHLKRINLEKLNFLEGYICGFMFTMLDGRGKIIASTIAEYLKGNCTLEFLNLGKNFIGHEGMVNIAEAMRFNSSLIELDLSYNFADDQFSVLLVEALKSNINLQRINLRGIEVVCSGIIFEHLASNSSLRFLDCSENFVSEDSIEKLSESLKSNSSLQGIVLAGNHINDSSVLKMCTSLEFNTSIQNIDLSLNPISDSGASAILDLLKKKQTSSLLMITLMKEQDTYKKEELKDYQIKKSILNEIEKQLSRIQETRNIAYCIAPIAICNYIKQSSNLCKLRFDKNIIKLILIPLLNSQRNQGKVKISKRQSIFTRIWSALSRKFSQ
jgi:hypothetical protein